MSTIMTSERKPSDTSVANHASNASVHSNINNKASPTTNPAHALIAGYIAGFSGTIVGYPLDSLKVWVQTNTLGNNKHLGRSPNGNPKLATDSSATHRSSSATSTSIRSLMASGARRSNSTNSVAAVVRSSATATMQLQQRATGAAAVQ